MLPSPILMVCTGNLCRSPFAEGLMRMRLEECGAYAEVRSCGVQNIGSQPVPETALRVAAEFGVDLSAHRSTFLSPELLQQAALILVMSKRQRQHLAQIYPTGCGKIFLLSQPDDEEDIPDPIGQPAESFRETYAEISRLVDAWLARFGVIEK